MSGGIGAAAAGAGVSQNVAYNIFNNIYSTTATMTAFGEPVTGATFAGAIVAGAIGAQFGNFEGVKGGALANIAAEIGFKSMKGAAMGFATGMATTVLRGSFKDDPELIGRYILYGAIGGLSQAVTMIMIGGPTYVPETGEFREPGVAYRAGHFLWKQSTGISLGKNAVTKKLKVQKEGEYREDRYSQATADDYNDYLRGHESGHFHQQQRMGFANFYGRIIVEYIADYGKKLGRWLSGKKNTGIPDMYDTPGTLEFGAETYALDKLGYFYSALNGRLEIDDFQKFYPNGVRFQYY